MLHDCDRCGGEGMEGHVGTRYDDADALDTCYHCYGTGQCACPTDEKTEDAAYD